MDDVIIAGGGPAGATAGKILAERGFSVLIVERCKLPRYKSCSGMIIKKSVDLIQNIYSKEIPDYVKCAPADNRGMIFTNDKGEQYKFEQKGFNVWRSSFDNWLLEQAIEKGAKVVDETSAINCEDNGDFISAVFKGKLSKSETAKYFIDCSGATGSLKHSVFGIEKDYIITYQAFYNGSINLDPHYFYAYLQPQFSRYDAWFNVKDNMLVFGVASKDVTDIQICYNNFINYMKDNHGLKIFDKVKEEKWIMPRMRPDFNINYGKGRLLSAGESAGFLNPMGEGISCAIESGCAVAKAIADNFDSSENVLPCYREYAKDVFAYMKRQWHLVGLMSERFSNMRNR